MANLGVETAGTAPVQQLSNNSGAGTTFGQSIADLISFYNKTPIAQQASTVDLISQLVNLGLVASGTTVQNGNAPNLVTGSTTPLKVGTLNVTSAGTGFNMLLPHATGSGNVLEFLIGTTVTSGSFAILLNSTTSDKLAGTVFNVSGASTACFDASAGTTGVSLNGTTTGGFIGDRIIMQDYGVSTWAVRITGKCSGVAATPLS